MKTLRPFFLAVDFGFIAYWTVTALHLIPQEWLFRDYENPMVVSWNWSFMPLDLGISATGLMALFLWRKADARYEKMALVSLSLTTASGFQAISYWLFQKEFDMAWWLPNLFLLIYPWFFIVPIVRRNEPNRR